MAERKVVSLQPNTSNMVYYIWLDESDSHGSFYSNFYGGILVKSCDFAEVSKTIQTCIDELHIDEEIKWQKVSEYWFERYKKLVDVVFHLMSDGKIKIRIFFRHNQHVALGLTQQQKREEYQRLYYQFIKHAFGLEYSNPDKENVYLKLYLDDMPLKGEGKKDFINCIYHLNNDENFRHSHINIRREDIIEVDSKKHILLQVMDVILGAMCFRLNEKYKEKPAGSRTRGRKTIIKEKLYKYINLKIRELKPNFNVGISTGYRERIDVWNDPYRHWSFIPKNHTRISENTKHKKIIPSNLHE